MIIKTAELTGVALDWAVITCLFPRAFENKPSINAIVKKLPYSTDWAQGMPIIDRERIRLIPYTVGTAWFATVPSKTGGHLLPGPTLLVAAMRCYVASKLGDMVDVPEELI